MTGDTGLGDTGLGDTGLGNTGFGDEVTAAASTDSVAAIRDAAQRVRGRSKVSESNGGESLIDNKMAPPSNANFWDRKDMQLAGVTTVRARPSWPRWFVIVSTLAVVTAVAVVLIILYVSSGNPA